MKTLKTYICGFLASDALHIFKNAYCKTRIKPRLFSKINHTYYRVHTLFFLGKIITEILQHLHACNDSVKVFYGRTDELKKLKNYICGESTMPFVLYGAGGSGKTAMIYIAAAKRLQE